MAFWKTKTLAEMSPAEWESVCDGCGKCCLISLQDEDTDEILLTDVHCKLFDGATALCSDYPNRKRFVPDCVILKPETVAELTWMPRTCAYRLLHEGKPLPDWHHLVSGSVQTIHEAGWSVQGATLSEETVAGEEALLARITVWPGEPGSDISPDDE